MAIAGFRDRMQLEYHQLVPTQKTIPFLEESHATEGGVRWWANRSRFVDACGQG